MFGPIWLTRHTFRGVSRRRRYCGQTDADTASNATHLKILVAITSPLWATFLFVAALVWINELCQWLANIWHQGPWQATAITTGAVTALGLLVTMRIQRRTTKRENPVSVQPSPTTTRYYTCCGMPAGQPHTNTCRQTPPSNPAQWSDRR
jgi:hypothetical protein